MPGSVLIRNGINQTMSAQSPTTSPVKLGRFKRYLCYLRPARWSLVGGIIAGLVYAASSGIGMPVMFKTLVPVLLGNEADAPPKFVEFARRLFGEAYQDKLMLTACLGLPLLFVVRGFSQFVNRYLINRAGFIMLEGLRQDVFCRLQELPLAFYHRHKSGDLVSRLIADTEQLRAVVVNISAEALKQPFTLLFAMGYLIYLSITERSALFALIALSSVPLCVVPIRMVSRHLVKRSREVARLNGELAAVITESLQSPVEIQSYNLQAPQQARFQERIRQIFRLSMKTVKYKSLTTPSIEFVSICGFMLALYVGKQNGMTEGTFGALGIALFLCYEPLKKLSSLNEQLKSQAGSQERLEQILTAEDTVANPAAPRALPAFPATVQFDRVHFRYATAAPESPAALADVHLHIQPGEVVALVGSSGAGKSTFVMMIPRFFDPTGGVVRLGGVDLRELDKNALRDRIALVPQMPVLFNATVAENIRFGRLSATDDEVRAAARKAHVAEFIESLPDGYHTVIRERGTSLSGGQRQRIAIARAFLKDAPILILDEATSALDSESESKVQDALRQLVQGRTVLMIAHRFSSISLATRILVFEGGRITGDGAPDVLAQSHAGYRRMIELQRLG